MKLIKKFKYFFPAGIIIILCIKCSPSTKEKHFTIMPSEHTGVKFENTLTVNDTFNIYTYRNFYNGGGVAIGDVNNDSLPDIYLTANLLPNKLYLNKGDFQFEDVTEEAGVGGSKTWSTGATMVDIDGDGDLDIYICNSGDVGGDNKQNELFINDGSGVFTESAVRFGLADRGYSTHAAFFDYDKDGDLDLYLLNNSYQAIGSFNLKKNVREVRDEEGGDKLFRNDGEKFVDVSVEAGIYQSVIGFGLGVTIGDINGDNWPDIYISNDFFEKDYVYINNQDGSFTDKMESYLKSISVASMGADMADINNDAYPDIFVTEMLPGDERRIKTKTTFEDWDKYQYSVSNDYYHQFTRNMLHLSNGQERYNEVGRLSGVHATDWSWGALIADYDNDGWKDLYVTNGIYQDLTDQDFLNYISNETFIKNVTEGGTVDYKKLIEAIPSERIPNYLFSNNGDATFENVAESWGLDIPSHSNGAAYGDLDLDGDLDLVVNNVNMEAFIIRNNLNDDNYLQLLPHAQGKNSQAIGSKFYLYTDAGVQFIEHMPMKGFQSSMDHLVHFGLGNSQNIDSLKIIWPDGRTEVIGEFSRGQRVVVEPGMGRASRPPLEEMANQRLMEQVTEPFTPVFKHRENDFVDFDRDRLLYIMKSNEGPYLSVADLNGDGKEDFFIGGAKGQNPTLFFQTKLGFEETILEGREGEDMRSAILDLNGDGLSDIYVPSGSNEFSGQNAALKDRNYINLGKGNFAVSDKTVKAKSYMSTSVAINADFDGDSDDDLMIGERNKPFAYGVPSDGYILRNDDGNFNDVTDEVAPGLRKIGLIRDAAWADINGDGMIDLIVVGEYMPVSIFINQRGKLVNKTQELGFDKSDGLWNTIEVVDIDNDGDQDFVVGNHGLNSRLKASHEFPMCMHVNDFDKNGSVEQIICTYSNGVSYPLALRHDLIEQLPHVKKKYLDYGSYAEQTVKDIFTEEERQAMITNYVYEMRSCIFINEGNSFRKKILPMEAQLTTIFAIESLDVDKDGINDLVMGGNQYRVKPEIGRYDASEGLVFKGDGKGNFEVINSRESGFSIPGEIRDIEKIVIDGKPHLLVARNNDSLMLFSLK